MKQPLWVINSSLLFVFLFGQLVFFLLHTPIPRRVSLEPDLIHIPEKNMNMLVSIQNIYEQNDLFGTYVAVPTLPKVVEPVIPVIPEAPPNIPLKIPIEPEKVFIAPLPVSLKGIMYAYDRPEHSVAIIQFQDSKEEINYKVGQLINDAQILKIYPNRVIVVRSNGQQETLYLREEEAGKDLANELSIGLANIGIIYQNGIYHVPVDSFTKYVKSLGQFIDLLDLTTVYQKGKSIGCRVGKAGKESLAQKLGFAKDDIIEQINNLPVTDIASRVLVFDHISEKKVGDIIHVKIDRAGRNIELKYMLSSSSQDDKFMIKSSIAPKAKSHTVLANEKNDYNIEEQRKKLLETKVKLAPTANQIYEEERRKLFEARRREIFANQSRIINHSHKTNDAHSQFLSTSMHRE